MYECEVVVDGDEIDRPGVPRFKGEAVLGSKVPRCAKHCDVAKPPGLTHCLYRKGDTWGCMSHVPMALRWGLPRSCSLTTTRPREMRCGGVLGHRRRACFDLPHAAVVGTQLDHTRHGEGGCVKRGLLVDRHCRPGAGNRVGVVVQRRLVCCARRRRSSKAISAFQTHKGSTHTACSEQQGAAG